MREIQVERDKWWFSTYTPSRSKNELKKLQRNEQTNDYDKQIEFCLQC